MDALFDYYFHEYADHVPPAKPKLLCRETQINQLYNLYQDNTFVDCVYLCGCSSSGKSSTIIAVLDAVGVNYVVINLVECYTAKILFEKLLNFFSNNIINPLTGHSDVKCDNLAEFISNLKILQQNETLENSVIVLDKAERLRDMDMNLLPVFCRFREISGLSISCVLISEIEFHKMIPKGDVSPPTEIYFPQYTKDDLFKILSLEFSAKDYASVFQFANAAHFHSTFINLCLAVFYTVCRDLSELKYMANKNFIKYCEPMIKNQGIEIDVMTLWRKFIPILKTELDMVYLRMNTIEYTNIEINADETVPNNSEASVPSNTNKTLAEQIELPFYAKYLLIAAYLASYNPAKEDKRLFMKFHGKKRKTKAIMNAKNKVTELLNTQLGPKPFAFDRLLAIFYAILDEKVGLNSNLLVQVSSLVHLQLLSAVGNNTSLENQKYKCNVSYEFINTISKMVGFNIRKYLYDFI